MEGRPSSHEGAPDVANGGDRVSLAEGSVAPVFVPPESFKKRRAAFTGAGSAFAGQETVMERLQRALRLNAAQSLERSAGPARRPSLGNTRLDSDEGLGPIGSALDAFGRPPDSSQVLQALGNAVDELLMGAGLLPEGERLTGDLSRLSTSGAANGMRDRNSMMRSALDRERKARERLPIFMRADACFGFPLGAKGTVHAPPLDNLCVTRWLWRCESFVQDAVALRDLGVNNPLATSALQVLQLDDGSDGSLHFTLAARWYPQLHTLRLHDGVLNNDALICVAQTLRARLRALDLSGTRGFSDAGVKAVAAYAEELATLRVGLCEVGDESLRTIAKFCPRLALLEVTDGVLSEATLTLLGQTPPQQQQQEPSSSAPSAAEVHPPPPKSHRPPPPGALTAGSGKHVCKIELVPAPAHAKWLDRFMVRRPSSDHEGSVMTGSRHNSGSSEGDRGHDGRDAPVADQSVAHDLPAAAEGLGEKSARLGEKSTRRVRGIGRRGSAVGRRGSAVGRRGSAVGRRGSSAAADLAHSITGALETMWPFGVKGAAEGAPAPAPAKEEPKGWSPFRQVDAASKSMRRKSVKVASAIFAPMQEVLSQRVSWGDGLDSPRRSGFLSRNSRLSSYVADTLSSTQSVGDVGEQEQSQPAGRAAGSYDA